MECMPTLQQKLTDALETRGWSDKDLADRVGVSASKLRRWRIGEGEPSLSEARRLAEALDVNLDYLALDDLVDPRKGPDLTDQQQRWLALCEALERAGEGTADARLLGLPDVTHGRNRRPPV